MAGPPPEPTRWAVLTPWPDTSPRPVSTVSWSTAKPVASGWDWPADSTQYPRAQPLDFGFHEAAHATAFGKVLLSALTPKQRRDYLTNTGMPKLTERTRVRISDLNRELSQVRRSGVARDIEEFRPELACVSAPVRDADDRVTAAVAFSVPVAEFAVRYAELERHVRAGAARLSRVLAGDLPSEPPRFSAV